MDRRGVHTNLWAKNTDRSSSRRNSLELRNVTNNRKDQVNVNLASEGGGLLKDGCEEPFVANNSTKLTGAKKKLYQHVITYIYIFPFLIMKL